MVERRCGVVVVVVMRSDVAMDERGVMIRVMRNGVHVLGRQQRHSREAEGCDGSDQSAE
jgi:hypothetical protein